jgi:carboxyl-terminal processing protease
MPTLTFLILFQGSDIGESALENALPWDTIPPARYLPYSGFSRQLPILKIKSQQRQANDPDFKYLSCANSLGRIFQKRDDYFAQ